MKIEAETIELELLRDVLENALDEAVGNLNEARKLYSSLYKPYRLENARREVESIQSVLDMVEGWLGETR